MSPSIINQLTKMSVSNLSSLLSTYILLSFSLLVYFPSIITCFDITKLLSQYPAYTTFNNYLTQTQLTGNINNRQSITVLAVDNSGMAPISGKSMDVINKVLSLHVILDYFDVQKFQHLQNQSITVRTLFDDNAQSQGLQGFLKVTDLSTGAVSFTSASETDDTIGANLIKAVVSQPYNISVVQVSTVIMPPFVLANANANANAPAPVPVLTPVPMPVVSPVPVMTPVPMPVVSPPVPVVISPVPVPVQIPIPVVSPVPVAVHIPVPVPVMSPPAPGAADENPNGPGDAAGNTTPKKSGVGIPCFGMMMNRALRIALTLFSMYELYSRSHTVHIIS